MHGLEGLFCKTVNSLEIRKFIDKGKKRSRPKLAGRWAVVFSPLGLTGRYNGEAGGALLGLGWDTAQARVNMSEQDLSLARSTGVAGPSERRQGRPLPWFERNGGRAGLGALVVAEDEEETEPSVERR